MLSLYEVLSITIAVWKCLTWHSDIMIAHKRSPTEEWVGERCHPVGLCCFIRRVYRGAYGSAFS